MLLNEVLSLNAQESLMLTVAPSASAVLNEVLSLNAQECEARGAGGARTLLNEVLSLNAQEFVICHLSHYFSDSSMKS